MSGAGGSIAGGLLQGIERGMRLRRQNEQEDERHKQEEEDRKLLREIKEVQLKRLRQDEADRDELRGATAPATVSQQGALPAGLQHASNEDADAAAAGAPNAPMPEVPRFRVETGQGVQRFDTQQQADAAAAQHNDPIALTNRLSTTLAKQGKVAESLQFSEKAQEYAEKAWQRKLQRAMAGGHEGLAQLVTENESGVFQGKRLKPVPSPDGKTVTYHAIGEDGTETPTKLQFPNNQEGVITAAYMLDRSVPIGTRYRNMVDDDRKRIEAERKERETDARVSLAEARGDAARTQASAAETRAEVALLRAEIASKKDTNGNGKVDSEDRKRWTSLHSEAGRQLTDARKRLAQLQGDVLFMSRAKKAGTPESVQLDQLQQDMDTYKQDRELYGSLLGGKVAAEAREQRGASTAPAGAAKPAQPASPAGGKGKVAAPKSKAEYEALPPGTKYQHPDDPPGKYRTKK